MLALARPSVASRSVSGTLRRAGLRPLLWKHCVPGSLCHARQKLSQDFSSALVRPAPFQIYQRKRGLLSKVWGVLPQPVKTFTYISAAAAVTVLLAPALLLFVVPPLVALAWYLRRNIRRAQDLLYSDRMSDLGSYQLFVDKSVASQSIPSAARLRVRDALESNENNLADVLGCGPDTVSYTPVESVSQDVRTSPSGTSMESIQVYTYGILSDAGVRLGTVNVVFQPRDNGSKKMRVEVVPARYRRSFILRPLAEGSDVIIDVEKKHHMH